MDVAVPLHTICVGTKLMCPFPVDNSFVIGDFCLKQRQPEMAEKRRVGRPRVRHDDAPGEYVGFRAPRALKEKLETAAEVAGRSLRHRGSISASEIVSRRRAVTSLAKTNLRTATRRSFASYRRNSARRRQGRRFQIDRHAQGCGEWFDEPKAFNQATEEIKIIIEALRPLISSRIKAGLKVTLFSFCWPWQILRRMRSRAA